MRRPFLLGVAATLVGGAVIAALLITSGVIDVAATPRGVQDRILAYASTRSIAHHASSAQNPLAHDPAAPRRGLAHYRALCADCHGGPGVDPEEFAAGLHPAPPDLASRQVQSFTDGMLYETVARGIGSTGMPAFGRTQKPDEIWSIVAFVRHLPTLTAEEKQELGRRGPETAATPARAPPEPDSDGPASSIPGGSGPQVHHVSISDFKFEPATLEVHVGDVIEWKNTDFVAHAATAEDRGFDTGGIQAGETKRVVARRKGRFRYFCRYHLAMQGTLIVQ